MNQTLSAYLRIILAMAIVGSSVVVGKLVIQRFPVFLASELRFAIATLILIPMVLFKEKRIPRISFKDVAILFVQAFTGVFLFNISMLYGLKYTTAIEGGIITSTLPAVVGLIAFFFLKEKLTMFKSMGIALAVLGILSINLAGDEERGIRPLFGDLLIFAAIVGEALFITIGKSVSGRVNPFTISAFMSIYGFLLFLPFAIYEAKDFNFSTVDPWNWGLILYYGIFVTVIAFILMYQGLAQISASSAGVLTGVIPITTIILSFLILKEKLMVQQLIGIFFVLISICFLAKNSATTS